MNKIYKKKGLKEYTISGATLKDKTCKLFKTKDGTKIAICRDNDKIKVFEIDESQD